MRTFAQVTGTRTAAASRAATPLRMPARNPSVQTILNAPLQPKLTIGAVNDPAEAEADRIAEAVMRMPDAAAQAPPALRRQEEDEDELHMSPGETVQRKCADCEAEDQGLDTVRRKCAGCEAEQTLRPKEFPAAPPAMTPATESAIRSLGSGQPLPASERGFFEPRLGRDLSAVRLHTGDTAREASQAINARAFTLGHDIAFAGGEYAPGTTTGRHLMAHELAHVGQNDPGSAQIRRAEVEDKQSKCSGLTDIAPDINTLVNGVIAAARASPGTTPFVPFVEAVLDGTGGSGAVSPIETFVEGLPASKRFLPSSSLAGTRFSSLPSASGLGIPGIGPLNIYDAHSSGLVHVVGSTALISNTCVGADKLGHFFQQGVQYFIIKSSSSMADAESFGRATEIDRAGLGATGVYSNADLAANEAGVDFWEQLMANPTGFTFDIASFIAPDWNEYVNPNFYEASIAREVWAVQLTGRWEGAFGRGPAMQDIIVDLSATNAGTLAGTFEYSATGSGSPVTGTITGTIVYNTTSVSGTISSGVLHGGAGTHSATPVSGITVDFDWSSGTNNGKGMWDSVNEAALQGTYGNGPSHDDAGMFNIGRP